MLNSDKQKFERWVSAGLKQPVAGHDDFTRRLMARLDRQQGVDLLARIRRQEMLYRRLAVGLILAGLGLLLIPPVTQGLFGLLQTVFAGLIEMVLEPTLTGILIPAAVMAAVIAVLWNLIDMVSLE